MSAALTRYPATDQSQWAIIKTMHILATRLHNQHIITPHFKSPAETVGWFGVVQAQDLMGSLYAVALRTKGATLASVEQAIADKTIVRTWPLRGTIHLVLPQNARWMLALNRKRQIASAASNYRRAQLTPDIFKHARDIFKHELSGGAQRTRPELYDALHRAGIETSIINGEQRGMHLFVYWALKGLLCIGPRREKQQTFVLMDEWIPQGRHLSEDEALAELATLYFRSHGPATIKDFAWWAGLTLAQARRGLQQVVGSFIPVTVDNTDYWVTPHTQQLSAAGVFLLPPFDEYTVAYADRSQVIGHHHPKKINFGLSPNLIINGKIAGTWRRTLKKDSVSIEVKQLTKLTIADKKAIQTAADHYSFSQGLPKATITLI